MKQHKSTDVKLTSEEAAWMDRVLEPVIRHEEAHRHYLEAVRGLQWPAARERGLEVLKSLRRKLLAAPHGAPQVTLSLVNDDAWILYENGYIEFGRFDEPGRSAERLSHWVDWEHNEAYPQSELDLLHVMLRVLEYSPDEED